ncbi:MAG: DUF2971 domain-containing protein [Saprospiraceae bacterium]|nr:DUF2971 domain-containing protein [Saprospiraceae bacterium]MCF8250923.1 DUF2971 domain-containing protein [Saprospiraceae bacterium]MCF8283040.1 DUF2971 domain-containing protein [Bacteroidales bacterium]MCF8311888.1 DUF2971 domain-containing protein [Saprospiraceae bacterium]MCF8441896.1 DUF2971 domain-containing protein [Saprospiraceae bacterium]
MKTYKFRGESQIAFAFDIIINNRLYCANWNDLNDPMEGMYAYQSNRKTNHSIITQKVKGIRVSKRKYKICSLSETFDNHLLWGHYAEGFKGVAIEIELPDNDINIRKVEPRGVFAYLNMDEFTDVDEAARTILFSKYDVWSYEQEIRILNESQWYEIEKPITRVIVGHRMNKALFDVLNITCSNLGIELNRVGIGDTGIDADFVKPFKELKRKKEYRT